jgi:hypothetical protein
MSWKIRCVCLPLLAVAAVALIHGTAFAVNLTFDGAANSQPPFHNPGAPPVDTNYFTGDFNLTNGALTVGADLHFNFHLSANLGVTGASLSPTADMSIPTTTQAVTISGGAIHAATSPTGTAQLTLWDEQTGGYDPGGDGGNPNPSAVLPSQLSNADLTGLNVTLIHSGDVPNATTSSVSLPVNGSVTLVNNLFGLGIDISLPVNGSLNGNGVLGVNSLGFAQGSGDGLVSQISPLFGPALTAPDQSVQYLSAPNGTINAAFNAGVNGTLNLSSSILGIGFSIGSFPINLTQTLGLNQPLPLPGFTNLADLNPTGYDNVHHDDLQATIGLGGNKINLPATDLSTSGTAQLVTTLSGVASGITFQGQVTATITYGLLATLSASNLGYQLQDSVAGVVAPEPGSIVLLFVGLAGVAPFVVRRIRRR